MRAETIKRVLDFRDERDCRQFHNPKDLALSISLEASELLELFQWKDSDEAVARGKAEMAEELADILSYVILFADAVDLDLDEIVLSKIEKNAKKYPVELSKGSKEKYNVLKAQCEVKA